MDKRHSLTRKILALVLALGLLPLSGIAAFAAEASISQEEELSAVTFKELDKKLVTELTTKELETELMNLEISERRLRPAASGLLILGSYSNGVKIKENTDYPGVDVPYQATFTLLDEEATKVTLSCSMNYYTKKDGMDYNDGNTGGIQVKSIYNYKKGMFQTGYAAVGDAYDYEMTKVKDGVWQITMPLHSGVYYYGYNVTKGGEEKKILDPANPPLTNIDNDHDCGWSILVVGEPGTTLPGQEYTLDADESGQIFFDTYKAVDDTYQPLGIYLPPDYSSSRKYPTIYLSHGGGGSEADWLDIGRAGAIFDNLIADGEVEPTIVVTMDNTYWGWNYEKIRENVLEHIIPYIEDEYGADPSPRRRAFAGLSMGGLLTSNIIVNCPEEFGYYGVFSATNMGSMSEEAMDDLKEADPFIMMGWGIMDFGKGGYPSAANLFNENGFDNYYNIEVGGAHDWGVWRELLSIFAKDYLWVRELDRLVIDKAPAKTVYKEGETFDPAGMEVTAVYADGSTADVTDKAKFAPDGKLELDDKRVNVFYTEEKITVASYVNITVEKPAAHPFIDVPAGSYFEDAVTWAYNAKPQITDGNGKDLFMPYQYCTRGQVVTFLWRTMGCPEPKNKTNPFDDVTKDDYFYKPVLWAVEKGITDGTTETTFSPYNQCRNSHILTFIWRTLGRPGDTGAEKTTEWWADAEKWAKKEGLLAETYTDWFDVKDLCPRCNVVTFLYRALVK